MTTRTRKSTRNTALSSVLEDSTSTSTSTSPIISRRSSSRSNKFSYSMKEPTESLQDILRQSQQYLTPKNSKKRKKSLKKGHSGGGGAAGSGGGNGSGSALSAGMGKSPAVSHTKARRQMKVESRPSSDSNFSEEDDEDDDSDDDSDDDDNDDDDDDEDHEEVESQDSDAEEEEESEDDSTEEEESEMKIQRIIAVRSEPRWKWKEICKGIHTSEIESGSRWFQEDDDDEEDGVDKEAEKGKEGSDDENKSNDGKNKNDTFEERFFVKWAGLSFLHCSWETQDDLIEQVEGAKTYLTTFFRKSVNGLLYDADDRLDGDYFDPGYVQIERILEVNLPESVLERKKRKRRKLSRGSSDFLNDEEEEEDWGIIFDRSHPDYEDELGRQFLIKWGNSPYTDATYEYERDLIINEIDYDTHVKNFLSRSKKPTKTMMKKSFSTEEEERRRLYKIFGDRVPDGEEKESNIEAYKKKLEDLTFKNGGQLRDYQAEGVSWLLANHVNKRSAILADEMGLGKTIQTAAYIHMVHTTLSCRGPFLIVAPLSTIPHWQREFTGWTNMNTIVYHGSAENRNVIREYDFAFECDRPQDGIGFNQRYLKKCHHRKATRAEKIWMVEVVITTPEMLVTDDFSELMEVKWEVLVVDEAHRMKNHNSRLALNLRSSGFNFKHTLLLTGTPIQNNMNELWTLLNFIDPPEFDDCDSFMELYGNMKSKESVDGLHGVIRPYILRRLKEDVEKSVPPKEETLIEVELTLLQKQYYRALYEKNVQFLHRDCKKALDGPSINNLAMQLRKCCNHPFLLKGVEEKMNQGKKHSSMNEEADFLVKSSGKLVLLDKLLPKLKEGGHRLLIFSQFKIMLDILEDYLSLRNFKFERIDGSITGKKRQMAIDRYQSKTNMDSSFIMLLSTRAGGVGINLTAADTCLIFDSDWNPQNDLQAQARCHRIGQTKSVKVYRLLTRKTYEMQMFHMSSLKMGLDQAVLQGIENGTASDQSLSKEEVEKLLRCGAYDIFSEEQSGVSEKESNDFVEQDIDSILARRTKTVIHENTGSKSSAAGGTFSKASFIGKGSTNNTPGKDVDIDDPDFWKKMVGAPQKSDNDEIIKSGKKRVRNKANYNEQLITASLDEHIYNSDKEETDNDNGYSSSSSFESDTDDFTTDQACEFNFSAGAILQNRALQDLLDEKKKERLASERRRWGGSKPCDWSIPDVVLVMNLLHKFGYNENMNWKSFLDNFHSATSKCYEDQEVKRMCWALSLITLQEAVHADVEDVAKRLERATQKKKADNTLEVSLVQEHDSNSKEWKEKQLSVSFDKIWASNKWAVNALTDAITFSETKPPRDPSSVEERRDTTSIPTPLYDAFVGNIWPALKTRGWNEQLNSDDDDRIKRSWTSQNGQTFRFVGEILDILPSIYPELAETVSSVIASVSREVKSIEDESAQKNETVISKSNPNSISLEAFLLRYGPMQLLVDRKRDKAISLSRRNLEILTYLRNADFLVNQVNAVPNVLSMSPVEKYQRLSTLLSVNPRASLPHPSWAKLHDAILVSAIAKHGWIDKESHVRAIIEDKDIRWGRPFDQGNHLSIPPTTNTNNSSNSSSDIVEKDRQKQVALRAVAFLNELTDCKDLKGFNLNLVLKSYGIVSRTVVDEDGQAETNWLLDPDSTPTNTEGNTPTSVSEDESYQELPTRKDLLKRAKTVLSKCNESDISSNNKTTGDIEAHKFYIIDQSNISNIFLAELLRSTLKQNQKNLKMARALISLALRETQNLMRTMSSASERADFSRLRGHIALVDRSIKTKQMNRPVKNVLRAILGISLSPPVNPGDEMFIDESSSFSALNGKFSNVKGKNKNKKINESAVGDLAINNAISVARQRAANTSKEVEGVVTLGITTIETLIVSVMCSQGIPIYSHDWEQALNTDDEEIDDSSYFISWFHMGHVLEVAAEKWVEISQANLDKAPVGTNTTHLEDELQGRQSAHKEAMRLHQKPIYLAKKTIMLIEAIRLHSLEKLDKPYKKGKNTIKFDKALGNRVFLWNKLHLIRWSKALNVFSEADGHAMHATVMTIRPSSKAEGCLDTKNCLAIFTQISQQTRLRSLFSKYQENELYPMVFKAVKNVQKNGDIWDDQPYWWGEASSETESKDDFDLLSGVLRFGYGGFDQMLEENKRFSSCMESGESVGRLYRSSGQQRVNYVTRELSGIDDSLETLRIMQERRNRLSSLSEEPSRVSTGNSIQVGIDAFFSAKTKNSSVPATDGNSSDDSDIAIVAVVSPKRNAQLAPHPDSSPKRRKM